MSEFLAGLRLSAEVLESGGDGGHVVVGVLWCVVVGVFFGYYYDVGLVSDVFFWAAYFCAVAYGCYCACEVARYVVDG